MVSSKVNMHGNITTKESYDQKALHSINSLQSFAQPHKVKVTHWNKLQAAAAKSPWQAARSMCTAMSSTEESCNQNGTTQHKLAAAFCTTPHGKGDTLEQAPSSIDKEGSYKTVLQSTLQ
ncbi:hypothetical protein ACFX1Z_014293 [Malus domestica]